jgi:demethylmenaquinone methyltransferase/2-methoxy-6-polyprenyl-1,4-benzoquinol methylase
VTDIGDALKQMRDLLVPGDRLRLVESTPHWCNAIIWLQWRHRTFAREEIHALVKDVGFEIESADAFPSGAPSHTSRGIVAQRI